MLVYGKQCSHDPELKSSHLRRSVAVKDEHTSRSIRTGPGNP